MRFACIMVAFSGLFTIHVSAASLSGPLDGRVVLDTSGSPYSITGDVYIGAGDTLVIEPGVVLSFDASSDDQFGGLSMLMGEVYLEAGGVLLARGTAGAPIVIQSSAGFPGFTDYHGIVVAGDGCRVELAHVIMTDPYYGLYAENTDSCFISLEHTAILAPYMGMYCSGGGAGQSVTVDSCRIARSAVQGIYLNQTPNVYLHATAVDSSEEDGIHVEGSGCDASVRISDNTLMCSNTAKNGINVKSAYPLITGNTLAGGWASNIYLNSAAYTDTLSGNTLTGGIYGIFITSTGAPVLRDNAIDDAFYLVFNQSAEDVDARYNWWGASATAEMNAGGNPKNIAGIYDQYDSGTRGMVAYAGWLGTAGGDPVYTGVAGSVTLTDAAGDSVLVFSVGDTAWARVADTDLNTDSSAVDSVPVYFTSSTETVAETVVLMETDTASGIFTGGIIVDTGTAGADGILQLERGDDITVTYADAEDEYGEASEVTDAVVFGITLVSGGIDGAVTWSVSESPYLVTGDILVSTADTLVIEPGVTVYFNAGSDDQNTGSDLNVSEIFVNGTGHLQAVGTAADSIVFTSYASMPDAGDWAALYVNGDASIRLEYCRISYANYGIQTSFRTSLTDSVIVRHCRISDVNRGVYLYQNQGAVLLEGNHFYKTTGNGVYAGYCHRAVITGNRFDTTGNTAVYIYNAYGIDTALVVTDNELYGAGGSTGLYVRNSRPLVRNNRIENYGTGISLTLADSTLPTDFELLLNDIIDGSIGIAVSGYAAPSLKLNNVYGQSLRRIDNQSARDLDARYNWWGSATAETLATGQHPRNLSVFLDSYDNGAYGTVDYGTWLDTLTGDGVYIYSAPADTAAEEAAFSYTVAAADRDNAAVVSFGPLPGWLMQSGATVSGTPDDPVADTMFTAYADDGESAETLVVQVTVLPVNDAPVVTGAAADTATEEQAYQYIAAAVDPDDTPTLDYGPLPGWLTQYGDTLKGIPDDGDIDTVFMVYANDGKAVDSLEVALTVRPVNDAPVIATVDPDTVARANEPYMQVVTADDADGDTVVYYLLHGPAGLSVDSSTGAVAWTPAAADTGLDTVAVQAADGQGGFDTLVYVIRVLRPVTAAVDVDTLGTFNFDGIGISAEFVSLTGSGTVQATVHADSFPPDLPGNNPVKRFYTVTADSAISGMTVVLTFTYDQAEFEASDIADETSLYAARWNGSEWEPCASTVDTAANTVSCTTTAFSLWSIGGEGGPVPVVLSSFAAETGADGVHLTWTTESECDNYGFNVLRKGEDDPHYTRVNPDIIAGAGTVSQPQSYYFNDTVPAGMWMYVLEIVALDGSKTVSDALEVEAWGTSTVSRAAVGSTAGMQGDGAMFTVHGMPVHGGTAHTPGVYVKIINGTAVKVFVQ